jgi:hypothetical protein
MYTIKETLEYIQSLGDWGDFIDEWSVEDRTAIVWAEEVENKSTTAPWRTSYLVRYWENDEWVNTRSFFMKEDALDFARDFVNKPHRFPYPTD